MPPLKDKTPITCENCGYAWKYKGKLRRTTCPNCGNKTLTPRPSGLETFLSRGSEEPSGTPAPDPRDTASELTRKYLET